LVKSLIASLKGCSKPEKETLFGPSRNCENPKILRSKSVTKATLTKIGRIKIKKCVKEEEKINICLILLTLYSLKTN